MKTSPDQVVISLGVNSADRELGIARAQNDKLVKTIIAAAHKLGVGPEDVQTSSLNMRAEYSDEKVPKFIGYQVSKSIDVILKDPTKYERLMSSFLEAGGNAVHGIRFVVSDERKYRDEARTKALRAAKEKAVAMAAELGQTVGKPWNITENSEYCGSNLAANSINGGIGVLSFAPQDSTIAVGQVTLRSSATVSFQLE